jgi:hypothetical protein
VREDTLIDMAMHMTSKVGLVHQMPYICNRKGFASNLEKVCLFLIYNLIMFGGTDKVTSPVHVRAVVSPIHNQVFHTKTILPWGG